nr:MAG TPA: hypothetical protein [Caudoviricetes sp.]
MIFRAASSAALCPSLSRPSNNSSISPLRSSSITLPLSVYT